MRLVAKSARRPAPLGALEWNVPALIERIDEGVAVCNLHGGVVASNAAWRKFVGTGPEALRCLDSLFGCFIKAAREGRATGTMDCGNGPRGIKVSTLGEHHFLLNLAPEDAPSAPRPDGASAAPKLPDASPFGAALLASGDPLSAPIVEANPKLEEMAGGAARQGVSLGELLTPASRAEVSLRHASGATEAIEVSLAAAPDRVAHLYLTRTAPGWAAYLLDVTDQKSMQLQLAQRNKMEAIGQLAGGVAHDFNNLLTAIRLRADELLLRHPLGDPSYDNLGEIRDTVLRAAALVRQLLTFSRKATTKRETIDLGDALMNFEILLRRLLREDVRLETDYGRSIPLVRADRAQLENAVMNLVVNARDAVRAHGGGMIRLRCAGVSAADAASLGLPGQAPGRLAMIEVSDDGPGIPAEVAAHIFEPFFTTKGVGEGTGLGLSTVYGMVKQANGWITSTIPRRPAARRSASSCPKPRRVLDLEPPPHGADHARRPRSLRGRADPVGRGRAFGARHRRPAAARPRLRGDRGGGRRGGPEICKAEAGRIDLMISDVIMPGIDGPTLLKAARPFLGEAPVMFISGYAEAEFSDLLEGEPGVSFLAKPIDIMTLAEQVKLRLSGR